jgi:hypothetical protein
MSTYTWLDAGSGNWADPANWGGGVPNDPSADVSITGSGPDSVGITNGDVFYAASVTLDNPDANLQIDGALLLAGTLFLNSGTVFLGEVFGHGGGSGEIVGGTIDTGSGTFQANSGGLSGVAFHGVMAETTNYQVVTLDGAMSFAGAGGVGQATIDVTGVESLLKLTTASGSIDNLTIDIGTYHTLSDWIITGEGETLTLGVNATINHVGQYASLGANGSQDTVYRLYPGGAANGYGIPDGTIINDGTINAGFNGGSFSISPDSFTNNGTISISGGDTVASITDSFNNTGTINVEAATLDINTGAFVNTGTIIVDGASALEFVQDLTTAQLATIDLAQGATVIFGGTLDNTGATFVANDLWAEGINITGTPGTIEGGTIAGTINIPYRESLTLAGDVSIIAVAPFSRAVRESPRSARKPQSTQSAHMPGWAMGATARSSTTAPSMRQRRAVGSPSTPLPSPITDQSMSPMETASISVQPASPTPEP